MFLNTVSGRDPINGQPMVDPTSQQSSLPIDAIRIIFQNLNADLPSVALACRSWKALADNEVFRQMIRPIQAFGTQEWKEYIGVDAGIEPPLPRRAYGDLEKEDGYLTFIPDKVKEIENGNEVLLDNLEAIGKLVKNPKNGNKTGYHPGSWRSPIFGKIKQEKPHWVWIKKEVIGRKKTHEQQRELIAKKENKKTPGANISGLIDSVISFFMEYVRSGEQNFVWYPSVNNLRTAIRVNEACEGYRICLCFFPSGLHVDFCYDLYDFAALAVAPARKSIGI